MWKAVQFPLYAIISEKCVKYHVRSSSIEVFSKLHAMTCQTVDVGFILACLQKFFFFFFIVQPFCRFHMNIKMKKNVLLCTYSSLFKVVFCSGDFTVPQAVRSAEAQEIKSLFFPPLHSLPYLFSPSVCVSLSLSLAKHLLCWAHFLKCELNYRFLISSKLGATRPLVNSMDILSQMKK